MAARPPRRLRRQGRDPARDVEALRADAERLRSDALTNRSTWSRRPPLLVAAGASWDAVQATGVDARVDVLAPDELTAAAERAYIDLSAARAADEPALQGFVSALRGTAGELHALDLLSEGKLPTPDGTSRVELITHEFPGVDLAFLDADGSLIDTANVKIAASPDIALRHFGRHPDVRLVYAPTDTAERLGTMGFPVVAPDEPIPAEGHTVIDLGVPTEVFDRQIRDGLAGTIVDASTPLWVLVPWFGLSGVAVRAIRRMAFGARPGSNRLRDDLLVTASATGAGQGAALAGASALVAVPFALVGSWVAQAAIASRRSWRDAATRQRQLRDAFTHLDGRN